jgi:hypothetical protein
MVPTFSMGSSSALLVLLVSGSPGRAFGVCLWGGIVVYNEMRCRLTEESREDLKDETAEDDEAEDD